ncbi:MAG: tRNA (guanine(46)-N(7))-methyltransferase TrmB [Paracoccaceae bacterium]
MGARPHDSGGPWRNFYGRIKGKTMNKVQQVRLETQLKSLSPGAVGYEENPHRTPLDPSAIFGGKEIWLEIGFGGGEHLAHQAKNNPDVGFIGCEPFVNGVAMLLGKIEREKIANIRIYPGDVRDLFDVLPEKSIAKAFLLYPDPWPKKRHHRRRFVTPDHLWPLARVMQEACEFRVATDIEDYVRQTVSEVPNCGFDPIGDVERSWHQCWPDWLSTRYEQKALREGRTPHYLTFIRP